MLEYCGFSTLSIESDGEITAPAGATGVLCSWTPAGYVPVEEPPDWLLPQLDEDGALCGAWS